MNRQARKGIISQIGQLEETHCEICTATKGLQGKGYTERQITSFCVERCEIGKEIRALGKRLMEREVEKDFYLVNHLDTLGKKGVKQVAMRLGMTQKDVLDKYKALKKTHHMAV